MFQEEYEETKFINNSNSSRTFIENFVVASKRIIALQTLQHSRTIISIENLNFS